VHLHGSLFSFLSQFSKIVPIEMAYLRYAVCGCCLCIKNANCYTYSISVMSLPSRSTSTTSIMGRMNFAPFLRAK